MAVQGLDRPQWRPALAQRMQGQWAADRGSLLQRSGLPRCVTSPYNVHQDGDPSTSLALLGIDAHAKVL